MSLLVIAEHDNASLKTPTLNAVTAAAKSDLLEDIKKELRLLIKEL